VTTSPGLTQATRAQHLATWAADTTVWLSGNRVSIRALRFLAESRAPDQALEPELAALLRDRASLAANALATMAAFVILVLMVWRPD